MPVVSAASWAHADAISRRSAPRASMSARRPPSSILRPAARNSSRMKPIRSPIRVIFGYWATWAPLPVSLPSSPLPFAPPACVITRATSGGGSAASAASSSATSLLASWASRITTTGTASKSDGAVIRASSPGASEPAATSRGPAAPAVPATPPPAAAARRATARSTSNSSSPVTTLTRGAPEAGAAPLASRTGMPAASHEARGRYSGLGEDGLAAAPHLQRAQPIRPGERALVVGVPGHDVGVPARGHGAQFGGAQRLGTPQGRRAQGLTHAHAEVRDREGDDQRHVGDAVDAGRVVRAQRHRDALVEQQPDRRHLADLERRARAEDGGDARRGQDDHVLLAGLVQQVRGRAAEFRGQGGRAGTGLPAHVQPGQQTGRPAGAEHPARLALGEPALFAVHVHA